MLRKLIIFIAVLALASMACGFNINLPQRAQPIPEVVEDINLPYPKADDVNLKLSFGAGEMKLSPGADQLLDVCKSVNSHTVTGRYRTP